MKLAPGHNDTTVSKPKAPARANRSASHSGPPPSSKPVGKGKAPNGLTEERFIERASRAPDGKTPSPQERFSPQQQLVHIELIIPAARKVCIAGTFNDWEPEGGELMQM